jgi:hypothetical protein
MKISVYDVVVFIAIGFMFGWNIAAWIFGVLIAIILIGNEVL